MYLVALWQRDDGIEGQFTADEFDQFGTDANTGMSTADWRQVVDQPVVSALSIEARFEVIGDALAHFADCIRVGGGCVDFPFHGPCS